MINENTKKTEELKNVSEKLVVISERVNTLFKYKDDHEERIKGLEDKVKQVVVTIIGAYDSQCGYLWEITYNGDKKEFYVDQYRRYSRWIKEE